MIENIVRRRKAISPFLTMFSTAMDLLSVKMWHCVVMGLHKNSKREKGHTYVK